MHTQGKWLWLSAALGSGRRERPNQTCPGAFRRQPGSIASGHFCQYSPNPVAFNHGPFGSVWRYRQLSQLGGGRGATGIQWVKVTKATNQFTMLSIALYNKSSWSQMWAALRSRNHRASLTWTPDPPIGGGIMALKDVHILIARTYM